jgi:hypothetical protein
MQFKKMFLVAMGCIFIAGCTPSEDPDISYVSSQQRTPPVLPVSRSGGQPTQTTQVNADWLTYQNEDLGISFQYPSTLGQAHEQTDANGKIRSVRLGSERISPEDMIFDQEDYDKLRSCEDVLAKGFQGKVVDYPSQCEMISTDNGTAQLIEFTVPTGAKVKVVHLPTKKGIWRFISGNENLSDTLIQIAKTVKYL